MSSHRTEVADGLQRAVAVALVPDGPRARTVGPAVEVVIADSPDVRNLLAPRLVPPAAAAGHVERDGPPGGVQGLQREGTREGEPEKRREVASADT